jgi:GAF domain-containing protein
MSEDPHFRQALAVGMLPGHDQHRELLQSIVDVARAIFDAKAASIFLLDDAADELVFEAVSGEGEGDLIGMRIPADKGIAGWVLLTGQPIMIDDLSRDPRFNREAAEQTGYVPTALMAVPLVYGEHSLGVLQVLDRSAERAFPLSEVDLLIRFANQAAIGLELLRTARRARSAVDADDGMSALLARIGTLVDSRDDGGAGLKLLEALEAVLARRA